MQLPRGQPGYPGLRGAQQYQGQQLQASTNSMIANSEPLEGLVKVFNNSQVGVLRMQFTIL